MDNPSDEAIARIEKYLAERAKVRQHDQEEIHSFHMGDEEREAVLRVSDIRLLLSVSAGAIDQRNKLVEALEAMRSEAVLLLNNAEGCARNHYGEDFGLHGMPQWLADCRSNIAAATQDLTQIRSGQ